MDSFATVTHQSYGNRVGGACKGMVAGIIFGIAGIALLSWNEGNSVRQYKALNEGLKAVIDVPITSVAPENEGKLIHFIGDAESSDTISDSLFGVAPPNILKLKRNVEMYQWVEKKSSQTQKNAGGSTTTKTTYTYDKAWMSTIVDSSSFGKAEGHTNPSSMTYQAQNIVADPITVGSFTMSQAVTNKMNWFKDMKSALSVDDITDESTRSQAKKIDNGFFFGNDSKSPEVGDTRVSFETVPEQTISVVARQTSDSLSAYISKSGGTVLLVEPGTHDAAEMFKHANDALKAQTWLLRFLGFILIFAMFQLLTKPLETMANIFPCVGNLSGAGSALISFVAAAAISLVTIAIAWFFYRPFFSVCLFGVVGGLIYYVREQRKMQNTEDGFDVLSVDDGLSLTEEQDASTKF